MSLVEWGTDLILDWISAYGYAGIVFLMTLESACMPVPSEIVMPFAGYLVYEGNTSMTLIGIGLAGALGCTVGSIVAYVAGMYAGRPLILRYGRYFLITPKHLDMAEKWFEKYGEWAAFLSRLMPIVRTFISLPAGIARMDFKKFVLLSFLGSLPWTFLLAYIGYALGPSWEDIMGVFRSLDILIIAGVVAAVAWYVWKLKKSPEDEPAQP